MIDVSGGWSSVFSTAPSEPILVIPAGVLAPGRSYTFSLTATDSSGSGYAGKRFRGPHLPMRDEYSFVLLSIMPAR